MKIENLHLCLSNYSNQFEHFDTFKNESISIIDKSHLGLKNIDSSIKITKIPNVGYNIFSYLEFIIKNYSELPEHIIFLKDNAFQRHFTYDFFLEKVQDYKGDFQDFFQYTQHKKLNFPISYIDNRGCFCEINNNWYASKHKPKYFYSYNDFYLNVFNAESAPDTLTFAPGANFIVSNKRILKHSRRFYENLKRMVGHDSNSLESHFLERSIKTIFDSNLTVKEQFLNENLENIDIHKDKGKKISKLKTFLYKLF